MLSRPGSLTTEPNTPPISQHRWGEPEADGVLPDGSAIAKMLANYSVMRDQAWACQRST
jgi:hypothetical protein